MTDTLRTAMGAREENLRHIRATVRQSGFLTSTILFVGGAALLVASLFFPYWRMDLMAPQYPRGLDLVIYVDHLRGDISEIDNLNHYIGMAPISAAAPVARQLAPFALVAMVLLVLATAMIHRKWFAPLTIPAMLFPFVFLAFLYYWMRSYGLNLDPTAAFSSSIEPFVPTILGPGKIAQFETYARLELGWWMALAAALMVMTGLHYRRAARLAASRELEAEDRALAGTMASAGTATEAPG